jgi:hypothetical protein
MKNNLDTVEVYIILLLTFGATMNTLVVLIWRIATGFNKRWDPTRWPRAKAPGPTFNLLYALFLMAVVVFQIWFWSVKIPELNGNSCVQYGFLFSKIRLNARWFRGLHIALFSLLLGWLVMLRVLTTVAWWRKKKGNEEQPLRYACWKRFQQPTTNIIQSRTR